tara:strand:- start:4042 stop:4206 length:165 start_codon:yes stop_codon:yes gene_type:complete
MIKYLLIGTIFIVLVFFSLNYWEKIKESKKKNVKTAFVTIFIIAISFLAFLLYD